MSYDELQTKWQKARNREKRTQDLHHIKTNVAFQESPDQGTSHNYGHLRKITVCVGIIRVHSLLSLC